MEILKAHIAPLDLEKIAVHFLEKEFFRFHTEFISWQVRTISGLQK